MNVGVNFKWEWKNSGTVYPAWEAEAEESIMEMECGSRSWNHWVEMPMCYGSAGKQGGLSLNPAFMLASGEHEG